LPFHSGTYSTKASAALFGVVHDVLHPAQRGVHELANELGLLLEHLIGDADRLRHVRKELVGGDDFHLHAGGLHRRNPIGHAGHARGLAGRHELPHPARASRLDVEVVGRQPSAREQAE
jgi:hypothetical protein